MHYEIKASGYEKRLIGGIVVTGGGAQLKHIAQLIEYVTGLDARVGLPNEHLAKGMVEEVKSPMYATAIGLVMNGMQSEKPTKEKVGVSNEKEEPEEKKKKWFDKFFQKGKKWLEDDDIEEFSAE